ncbi:MAG TPA: OsmC family protein [Candidatus Acidoferrum sp.]|nr:OsmC family protein [Candidatus Acidoferrum sp.]
MKATVKLVDGMMFVAESGTGHAVVIDGPEDLGGRNMGFRPMELMLMSVGACSSVDVVNILRRGRQQISGCEARLEAERADAVPAVFTKIHVQFVVKGKELDPAKVKRAVELSAEKYCSASIMLMKAGVVMTHGFEIVADEPAAA